MELIGPNHLHGQIWVYKMFEQKFLVTKTKYVVNLGLIQMTDLILVKSNICIGPNIYFTWKR